MTDLATTLLRALLFTLADLLAGIALGTWPQWGVAERACYGDGVL